MKKVFGEVREINVRELIPVFVRLQCWVLPALVFDGYVWYFGSLHPAFEMSCDIQYLEKELLIFLETWYSSFCIVCICFEDFRTNRPKNNGRSHRKENTNFPKWRWVRSKNVCLSSALLFSLVVTKKYVLRTSWGLSIWNNTCFFVQMQSHVLAALFFEKTRLRRLRLVLWLFTSCVWDVLCYRILIKTAFVTWAK